MSSAAQREDPSEALLAGELSRRSALKELAAERLAAHRHRRSTLPSRPIQTETARPEAPPEVARVRDAVAARYRKSQSYREFLAREAERAMQQAQAQVEVASRNAQAVTAAQRRLLKEIEQWDRPATQTGSGELFAEDSLPEPALPLAPRPPEQTAWPPAGERNPFHARAEEFSAWLPLDPPDSEESPAGIALSSAVDATDPFNLAPLQVRLHAEVELALPAETHYLPSPQGPAGAEELAELEEEIEFRRSPEFDDILLQPQPIPANIIEFPRELVAARKARPRLAEGPLRGSDALPANPPQSAEETPRSEAMPTSQLRIFEVEPEQISTAPEPVTPAQSPADAPLWQGLMLGAGSAAETRVVISPAMEEQLHPDQPMYAAPVRRRMASAGVDLLCVAAGLAASSLLGTKLAGSKLLRMPWPVLGGSAAAAFVVFALIYQVLFFTFNEATPGMRVARLAFCTFQERTPSRRAMRRRLISTALAASPLGLGLVWMLLDHDSLGWHDRMSRMYPRTY
ncbi:MAG: RDD family protein [Acidobacteriota bacterium]